MTRTIVALIACAAIAAQAQSPVDLGTIARIKQEALANSQVMDHVGWMSDVYGPRLTGTPQMEEASKWAMKRFTEWGLANVHQEREEFRREHERRGLLVGNRGVQHRFGIVAVLRSTRDEIEMLDVFPAGLANEARVVAARRFLSRLHGED